VLPKESKQRRQASFLFPPAHRNSRRRIGQGKSKDNSQTIATPTQTTKANLAMGWPFSFDVEPLMAP
ncbi:hypothetical protein, partial [Ralstonia pickettii]|uniref:hypothetical protein n=1 Tax=Ralstonia pickettii TaxID=329 RepID=UPI001C3F320F